MLKLYTDDSPGLKVDPVVVLVLSVGFIISVVALHSKLNIPDMAQAVANDSSVIAKITKKWTAA
jgi:hypothetical protein